MSQNPTNPTAKDQVSSYYQHRFLYLFIGFALFFVILRGVFYGLAEDSVGLFFTTLSLTALGISTLALKRGLYHLSSSLAILVFLSILLYSILDIGLGDTTIFWFFVFPVLAFFLKGKFGGVIWLLFLVLVVLSLFLASHIGLVNTIGVEYDALTFRQLIASLFLVSVFVYIYQDSVDEKEGIIQQRERELVDINTQLIDEIAQHKATGKTLAESLKAAEHERAKDEALLHSIGEGVFAIDKKGKLIVINPVARNFFNVTERDAERHSWYRLFKLVDKDGKPVPLAERPLQRTLKNGQKLSTAEYLYIDRNNQSVPVAITTTPVVLDKKVQGAVEVMRDISEEKAIERAKDEFVSLASHQLRTPLSAINWYSEALVNKKLSPERRKSYIKSIKSSAVRMTELVSDFLDVSRFELGTVKLRLEDVDLKELISQSLKELEPAIKSKQLKVKSKLSPTLPTLTSDNHLLSVIVQNLLSNAVKYTPAKGAVTVTLKDYADEQDGREHLLFSVEDSGIGIPERDQERLFTKLFRSENALEGEIEGTGLGLYIAKSAVSALGGEIWFESTVNKGSVFAVMLPLETKANSKDKQKGTSHGKTKATNR